MNHDRGPRASNEVVESRTYVQIPTELIISCVLVTYPTKERNGDGSGSDAFRDPVCATDGSVPAHFKFSTSRRQNLPPLLFFFSLLRASKFPPFFLLNCVGLIDDSSSHVQILRITTVIKKFNNNSTMASKKIDIKPGKAGKALRDVSSETKSRNSSTSTIASPASSAAATALTTPSGVRKPDRKRTGTSAHAEEMSSWLLARAAKRRLDKQALEAEVAKLEKWISDDVEKAAGWKITAEKLTNKEAGSSIDELFAAALI
ncbi:hypothetical protein DER44DRAFT_751558 [Fusarium oxysporum]|nr:hypothetical protein DER44DRAFT_751558 [Fusarium oxysporum]